MFNKSKDSQQRVHPRAIRHHGLLGSGFVQQHMVCDDKWSTKDLRDEFKAMAGCLGKHHVFKTIEKHHQLQHIAKNVQHLRKQCRQGRQELLAIEKLKNRNIIRNLLQDNKEQECLYQDMPVHQVVENIDQRTFVLRKEQDRLRDRKNKLEKQLKELKLKASHLEDRIKFQNIFELQEEKLAKECEKKLSNSQIRLKAIKTINTTYRKVLQVLRHDEMFYDPILQSLCDDINDQRMFIEHILDVGKPALEKLKYLTDYSKEYNDKLRWETQSLIHDIANKHKLLNRSKPNPVERSKQDEATLLVEARARYARTTYSMSKLENELNAVSEVINGIKFATLCSTATEIFPRIKAQIEHNYKLKKEIVCDSLCQATLETKEKYCEVLQEVIKNNLSQAEIDRLDKIKDLNDKIKQQDAKEKDTVQAMKRNNDLFVVLRIFLWNIFDMLRHVYKTSRPKRIQYPNSYLKLPLLKFETMTSCPPENMEEDINELFHMVRQKLTHLMNAFNQLSSGSTKRRFSIPKNNLETHREVYMDDMVTMFQQYDEGAEGDFIRNAKVKDASDDEIKETERNPKEIYSRQQMKAKSLHLVEENLKKD
ncbi:uncharacterized protein LOC133332619 [Musca vetustissima]|uniref:uncharacterized protein LOC133332619 n=1 Tax=Musca vetustissima TaxID=27455 RepID=UPI002AB78BFC|nr:uncharacterized protein LOC133332619 [Musca vetustissima]